MARLRGLAGKNQTKTTPAERSPSAGATSRVKARALWVVLLGSELVVGSSGCDEARQAPGRVLVEMACPRSEPTVSLLPLSGWEDDLDLRTEDEARWGPAPRCTSSIPTIEEGLVEFDTGGCGFYSTRAPFPAEIQAGSTIEIVLTHTLLAAAETTMGRMELRLDGVAFLLWETPIPAAAGIRTTCWHVAETISKGTMLGVHVSNHGANSWRIVTLRAWGPEAR